MPTVLVHGQSDDLIEVEGDLREEFSAYDISKYLHFDNGTILKIGHDVVKDKGWHIEVVKLGDVELKYLDPIMHGDDHYSDQLKLIGDITRVECWALEDGPDRKDMDKFFEHFDPRDYKLDKLVAVYRELRN